MKYDPKAMLGWNEASLALHYFDPTDKRWKIMPTQVDSKAHTLTVRTSHFTDYGLSEAADIQRFMPNFESAEPNLFTGVSSYNYGLEVPPGRGGLTPQLGLSYSSGDVDMLNEQAQASIVGVGGFHREPHPPRHPRHV